MITLYQIAKRWGLAPRTVMKWVQSGRLRPTEGTDRETWKFTAAAVNTFHAEHGFSEQYMPCFAEVPAGSTYDNQ